ncbi:unnamed protein product, partial [Brachionus calyciflorus]
SFYQYFEETYTGGNKLVKSSGRNAKLVEKVIDHMFDIRYWNLTTRINDCIPRTNNHVEAWHNAFTSILKSHPLVYELVDWFRKEDKLTKEKLVLIKTGVKYTRKTEYIKLDERIKEILSGYDRDNFDKFLDSLTLILDY